MFADIANVFVATYFVPAPAASVVHPSNAYPDLASDPELPRTVTVPDSG